MCGCLVLAIVVAAAVFCWLAWGQDVSVQQIEDLIRSWGMWGVLGSICLMIAHSFVPFPAEFVAFANGMTYGPLWGTLITWSGAMLGALIAFNLINYAAGLTRLTWWQFTWTTAVGILPLTLLMVIMGDNIESLGWASWLLLLVGGIALWLAVRRQMQARLGLTRADDED
jgi:uncharacterized membrane protein YdjX (TVP38/TMEM64 family)